MTSADATARGRQTLAIILACHVLLLLLLLGGSLDRLSFETSFQPDRPGRLRILAESAHGALEGRGLYDARGLEPAIGPYDAMAVRATPAEIAILGGLLAPLPQGWRFPLWLLLNELALLAAARLLWRHVADRRTAIALIAAWALGAPYLLSLQAESSQPLAALALLAAVCLQGNAGAAAYAGLVALRPFFLGLTAQLLPARRWRHVLGAAAALALCGLLLALHPPDLHAYLTRHPYGESYPGNLGLQAFLFAAARNLLPDRPLSLPVAGRMIYDLNILTLVLMRALVAGFVLLALALSWRARRAGRIGAVAALWACTWIAAGAEVGEGDFLLVLAGAGAMAVGGGRGWILPAAAIWLALPTPFALLPIAGIESWSPEFGWTTGQTLALHGFKLVPAAALYALAARACYRAYPSSRG